MSNCAIIVEELSKQYNIGALNEKIRHDTFRDKIASIINSTSKHLVNRKSTMLGSETFWAVKDVSFKVKHGEILGIIGKNGAGKSTLLKMLCRVTSPTTGVITINGRVGTLLEVGTGFHLELTGRENIYLSGAILGMDKAYIARRIDDIIQFSGISKFIDTPVKKYSSGMNVRLGFAVAAHLEPEVLLIDEVLAVGDAAFQKQCLNKMDNITNEGRTILLVSHNMASIRSLCSRTLLMENGHIILDGSPNTVISEYLRSANTWANTGLAYNVNTFMLKEFENNALVITSIDLFSLDGSLLSEYGTLDSFKVRISYNAKEKFNSPAFVVDIYDQLGVRVIHLNNSPISNFPINYIEGEGYVDLLLRNVPLLAGQYTLNVSISNEGVSEKKGPIHLPGIIVLQISERDVYNSSVPLNTKRGLICVSHEWKHVNSHLCLLDD